MVSALHFVLVKPAPDYQMLNILDRLECFDERQNLAAGIEEDASQDQQQNALHCRAFEGEGKPTAHVVIYKYSSTIAFHVPLSRLSVYVVNNEEGNSGSTGTVASGISENPILLIMIETRLRHYLNVIWTHTYVCSYREHPLRAQCRNRGTN